MTHNHVLVLASALFISITTASSAFAQEYQIRRIIVGNRLSIEVRSHWHVRDTDERKNIATAAEALRERLDRKDEPTHVSALSVVSRPEPTGAIIRVSFIPIDNLSQNALLREIELDRAGLLREVTVAFKDWTLSGKTWRSKAYSFLVSRTSVLILSGPYRVHPDVSSNFCGRPIAFHCYSVSCARGQGKDSNNLVLPGI